MKVKPTATFWFTIALILCLVSTLGAALVQWNGGKVKVKDLRWETSAGQLMSALLFIPENATEKTPAPAIVTSHGWYNNREMQDLNFVEYSRRGYVVMSIDMYGHGNSDTLINSKVSQFATGMTNAVELIAALPYVDKSRIGVTGHSNGARAANWAVDDDNKKASPLIRAVLLVANDATYQDANKAYYNKYGNRHVGIVAAQFDEFFFRVPQPDNTRSAPKDYINQVTAQSFLNFGIDPAKGEKRTSYTLYKQTINGKEAIRVIYNPYQIHPWNHFSATVVKDSVEFFEAALGAPNPLPSTNQVWQWKVFFNTLGLVGICIFTFNFAKLLLGTRFFSSLKATEPVSYLPDPSKKGKIWLWISLALTPVFSAVSYIEVWKYVIQPGVRPPFFQQQPVFFISCWAIVNALFLVLLLVIAWFFFGGKQVSLKDRGLAIGWLNVWKTILLALAVVSCAYLIVFISDWLFKVDYRIWVIPFKAFTPDKFQQILTYAPAFLIFYIFHSIAVNSYDYVRMGKKEWINVLVLALATVGGALFIVVVQYVTFFVTGKTWTEVMNPPVSNIIGIWLFPILVYFPLATVFDRMIFKVTKNPYVGGLIFGLFMVTMATTNTLTLVP